MGQHEEARRLSAPRVGGIRCSLGRDATLAGDAATSDLFAGRGCTCHFDRRHGAAGPPRDSSQPASSAVTRGAGCDWDDPRSPRPKAGINGNRRRQNAPYAVQPARRVTRAHARMRREVARDQDVGECRRRDVAGIRDDVPCRQRRPGNQAALGQTEKRSVEKPILVGKLAEVGTFAFPAACRR